MHTLANIEDITPDEMLHYLLYQTRRTNPMVHNVLKQCIRTLYACRLCFPEVFHIELTPISTTSGLCSTSNMRKYHQIDVYI